MSTLDFSTWMNEGGSVFASEDITTQTAGSTVETTAGSIKAGGRSQKPKVQFIDIAKVDVGVADNSAVQSQISLPTIFDPFTHDVVPETKIADENMDIFTPSIKLTDLFNTNMNP